MDNQILSSMISIAREESKHKTPLAKDFVVIEKELRIRRQKLLGSHILIDSLLPKGESWSDEIISALSSYLAEKVVIFWKHHPSRTIDFAFSFFNLTISALTSGKLQPPCVDDIIYLADYLIRDRKVYSYVLEEDLPDDMIGVLFEFFEEFSADYYSASFPIAVTAAIAVFLGALEDPSADNKTDNREV